MVRLIIFLLLALISAKNNDAKGVERVRVGAELTHIYLPMLQGKRVALFSNHTGILPDGRHTLDALVEGGVNVTTLFSPEHGFRGDADAGEHVASGVDRRTGIPIVSLYGSGHAKAMAAAMDSIDIVVVDIQDVGLRFYTYYITMLELMNAAAERGSAVMVLDRPNPNGMTVDGPILDMTLASGVGRLPIPVVHGLTLGEMAQMAVGEDWLDGVRKLDLTVIPCEGYTHKTRYRLPVAPSPNLPTMTAVYLYPSLCLFEATDVSIGRGTDMPFTIYGHPRMRGTFTFTPESRKGAKNPPHKGCLCHGVDLSTLADEDIIAAGINLDYLLDAYRQLQHTGKKFLTPFFDKLIGNRKVRTMIESGVSATRIKASWAGDVKRFKEQRKPYLIYPE